MKLIYILQLSLGALNLTREAQRRAQKAQDAADATEHDVADSERQYKRTEAIVNRTASQFYQYQEDSEEALDTLGKKIKELDAEIPSLNELVSNPLKFQYKRELETSKFIVI